MCKIHLVLTIICFLILGFSGISLVAVGPGLPKAIRVGEPGRCSSCPQGCCRSARGLNIPRPGLPWVGLGCSWVSPGRPKLHPWAPYPTCCHQSPRCARDIKWTGGDRTLMDWCPERRSCNRAGLIYLASETE